MAMTPLTGMPARTQEQSTFNTNANDFFSTKLPLFVTEANALQVDVDAKKTLAETAATTATTQAGTATTQAGNATTQAGLALGYKNDAAASAASAVLSPGSQATSASSITVWTGSQSLTLAQTGKAFVVGQHVAISRTSDPANVWMTGAVTAFNSGTGAMTVSVAVRNGSGTFSDWTVSQSAPLLSQAPASSGAILQTCATLSAPEWLAADGSAYLQASYPALFGVVGKIEDGGTTWTSGSNPSSNVGNLAGVPLDYLNGLWLLGGYTGSTAEIRTSTDGITFTQRTTGASSVASYSAFAYGAGLYVAVGGTGDVKTSPDGTTWTARTSQFGSGTINGVAYNGSSLFVAVGGGTSNKVATSTDGLTWTGRGTSQTSGSFNGAAYGAGLFVGVTDTSPAEIKTTTDGVTWTGRTNPLTGAGVMVRFVNGEFWLSSGTNKLARSADGINWTEVSNPLGANVAYGIAYGNGRLVVCGAAGLLSVSDDGGTTWAARTSGFASSAVKGVACNGSRFAIAGDSKLGYNTPYSYTTATQFVTPAISVTAPVKGYIKS